MGLNCAIGLDGQGCAGLTGYRSFIGTRSSPKRDAKITKRVLPLQRNVRINLALRVRGRKRCRPLRKDGPGYGSLLDALGFEKAFRVRLVRVQLTIVITGPVDFCVSKFECSKGKSCVLSKDGCKFACRADMF